MSSPPSTFVPQGQTQTELYNKVFGGDASDISDLSDDDDEIPPRAGPQPAFDLDEEEDESEGEGEGEAEDRDGDFALESAVKIPKKKQAVEADADEDGEEQVAKKRKKKKQRDQERRPRSRRIDAEEDDDEAGPAYDEATRECISTSAPTHAEFQDGGWRWRIGSTTSGKPRNLNGGGGKAMMWM